MNHDIFMFHRNIIIVVLKNKLRISHFGTMLSHFSNKINCKKKRKRKITHFVILVTDMMP